MPNPKPAPVDDETVEAVVHLKQMYLTEAANDISVLEECIRKISDDRDSWQENRLQMREVTHNVKGQGSSFNYPLMTQVGQSLSLLLKSVDSLRPGSLELVKGHVEVMRTVIDKRIEGDGGKIGAKLVGRLEGLVAQLTSPCAAATPAKE